MVFILIIYGECWSVLHHADANPIPCFSPTFMDFIIIYNIYIKLKKD